MLRYAASMGNTPTHVGKTAPGTKSRPRRRKHPHARGEDDPRVQTFPALQETPPRTWGRLCHGWQEARDTGNTPTHVGKTTCNEASKCGVKKHPHARGEDWRAVRLVHPSAETPPRTWGRLHPFRGKAGSGRNTPTHVGKTPRGPQGQRVGQKHPHARGEDSCPWLPPFS